MAAPARLRAVGRYVRSYHLAPRYGAEHRLALTAADGTRLVAHRVPGPPTAPLTVVLVHGLAHWSRHPRIHRFAHLLAAGADVVVPDLRGHGRSGGACSFGRDEHLDVAAAVAAADPDRPVVTVGVSLGAAAVLLHAARSGGVAGVVAVSPPAWWGGLDTEGARRIERWARAAGGRAALAALMRTRLAATGARPVDRDAAGVIAGVAPAFTLLVADPSDRYFGPEHAEHLYAAARDPKELWWVPGGGHGTDLLTRALAARLRARLALALDPGPQPGPA